MNALLIGYGEIGKGIYEVYSQFHQIDIIDPAYETERVLDTYDVMLVTIPYSDKFVEIVNDYQKEFNPRAKIIFSTLPVGTTAKFKYTVHVPIEGKHPALMESIDKWQIFMGGFNKTAYKFFVQSGKMPYILDKPEHTEFLKLQSTTNYGLMIEFARYCNEICKSINMDYSEINQYNACYNALYEQMNMPQFSRYILTPPEGSKGGHCVTNNAKILREQFPNVLIDVVAEVDFNDD